MNNRAEYEMKIYQISKSFYEFEKNGLRSNKQIIFHVVDEHRRKVEDTNEIGKEIPSYDLGGVTYYSYVYNEIKKKSYWERFLPNHISGHHNFEYQTLSFVLFASVNNDIFAIIGGGGIRVIQRYANPTFGIDFYAYLTKPKEDKIVSLAMRSISGKVTEQKDTYRNNQNLLDILKFAQIPTKIKLVLREELKKTVFSFIPFSKGKTYLEISSSFHIKHKISFYFLHQLFQKINEIHKTKEPYPLTSFIKVQNPLLKEKYDNQLVRDVYDDMFNLFGQTRDENTRKLDIDFIHPSKLHAFYDSAQYQLRVRDARRSFFETLDMNALYKAGLKHLYENLDDVNDFFEFRKIISGMRVFGVHNEKKTTTAMFLNHITCEINYLNKPIFKINNIWYKVKNNFIKSINDKCIQMLDKHYLKKDFLNIAWTKNIGNEGDYNLAYTKKPNYYVFDKQLGHNIELCDIMYEDEKNMYLVHVKDGFDAKIRDVSSQIDISAARLQSDINTDDPIFLKQVINRYNKRSTDIIVFEDFIKKFKTKEIIYVLAYRSRKPHLEIEDRINKSKSNIAKYSLIQCVQDMTNSYQLKLFDISDVQ